ncbi:MAG TPA: divergent polysaccharide deacetylase family protein [Thermoanaerobaculia bacterium]|nr:divergent polysaccharide deacetylase family protein [Thermoanaerobaculia bacterium]
MAQRRTTTRPKPKRGSSRSSSPRRSGGLGLFLLGLLVGAAVLFLVARDGRFTSSSGSSGGAEEREERVAGSNDENDEAGSSSRRDRDSGDDDRPDDPRPQEASITGGMPALPATKADGNEGEEAPAGDEPVARIALVIDDLGRSVEDIRILERLGVPITYAVLPYEEETPAVAAELRQRNREILLHLPMEPRNRAENPGPGALLLGMPRDQLRELTAEALQAVPGAVGVNNHMGSGLTEDEGSMEAILSVLVKRKLFFLDSRTSAQSVGYRTAMGLGLPAAERQVFLDPDPRPEAIRTQFQRLLDLARQRGAAIAIGHPLPATLAALAEEVPRARAAGFEFVPVSYLLDQPGDAPE